MRPIPAFDVEQHRVAEIRGHEQRLAVRLRHEAKLDLHPEVVDFVDNHIAGCHESAYRVVVEALRIQDARGERIELPHRAGGELALRHAHVKQAALRAIQVARSQVVVIGERERAADSVTDERGQDVAAYRQPGDRYVRSPQHNLL